MITLIELDHFTGQRNIAPDPDDTARDLARLIRELQGAGNANDGRASSYQVTAATLAQNEMIAPGPGSITAVKAVADVAAAAGESMTVDVKINGVTVLTAVVTLDDSAGTDVQSGSLDTAVAFVEDDLISIERTYTAGGGPTPMTDTLVDVYFQLD